MAKLNDVLKEWDGVEAFVVNGELYPVGFIDENPEDDFSDVVSSNRIDNDFIFYELSITALMIKNGKLKEGGVLIADCIDGVKMEIVPLFRKRRI